MVTITMTADAASGGTIYEEGQSYDVSVALAQHFVEAGYASTDEEMPGNGETAIADSDSGAGTDSEA